MAPKIPLFYRILFQYLDPLLNLSGIYLSYFDHSAFIDSGLPTVLQSAALSSPSITSHFLLSIGAYSIGIQVLQILLLHQYRDVKIWRILEGSLLATDLALLYGVYVADPQGSLALGTWGQAEWTNNGILGTLVILRSAFVLGVGS